MSTTTATTSAGVGSEVEFATFYVGDLLIGADIHQVDEMNRHVEVTPVPHAPDYVRGVINIRGEVVTVVDPRTILGVPKAEVTEHTRNVVFNSNGEQVGLLVDRIADVVRARQDEIDSTPANIGGVDGRFFKGIYKLETELLVILDVEAMLHSQRNDH